MAKFTLFLFSVVVSLQVSAQPKPVIPLMRKIFHDNVDRSQKWIDQLDKKDDKFFHATADSEVNMQINYSLFNKVDEMQDEIESDTTLDGNGKIKFIRGLNDALTSFESGYRAKELKPVQLPDLINAYAEAMVLEKRKESN